MNSAQRFLLSAAGMLAALPCVAYAQGSLGVTSMAEANAMYKHDVAACKAGAVPEDRRTCLYEAKQAYEQARREAMQHQRGEASRAKAVSRPR